MRTTLLFLFAIIMFRQLVTAQAIVVDAGQKHQTIIGFGVNANPQSWNLNPDSVKKVVDQLIDSLGCTSFRLMFDDCDWEAVNDNADPNVFNWTYYDSVYSRPRFTGVWDMIAYLNQKGITDITLSPDGAAPAWMGVTRLLPGFEQEYAETISSMVIYGRQRHLPLLHFNEISPINESSCNGGEGVATTKEQFGKIYQSVAEHLDQVQLSDMYITGPDDCNGWRENFEAMSRNPITMKRIRYFGQHDYGDESAKARELVEAAKQAGGRPVIMSEVNAVCVDCDGGVYNKDYGFAAYAKPAYKDILQDLNAGVSGVQVWEAYDSRYHHPNRTLTWSMWGIFAVNDTSRPDVYTERPHFGVLKHLYKFVRPGDRRVDISGFVSGVVISAFVDSLEKKIVITGVSNARVARVIRLRIANMAAPVNLNLFVSDAARTFQQQNPVVAKAGIYYFTVLPNAIFTLSGNMATIR